MLTSITFVTFKWHKVDYRSKFTSANVNTTKRMIDRCYPLPHRFICVTDDSRGLDPDIEHVPLWKDHANIQNPSWPNGPSCYVRLKVFSEWFAKIAGERIVCIDLDAVFTGDLTSLFKRTEDFLIWQTGMPRIPFCASMFMFTAGVHERIWSTFDPNRSPRIAITSGMQGSDQAWIAYCLGKNLPGWGVLEGVYGYKEHIVKHHNGMLPKNAKAVMFTGKPDPWESDALRRSAWIKEHYI